MGAMLDDPDLRTRVDTSRFWQRIVELPLQARKASELGRKWEPPQGFMRPRRIILLGVGGSAIGGDVVATIASRFSSVPVEVVRDYSAPTADRETLIIACSFSGQTEEVLTAFLAQLDGECMCLALTTGGALGALALEHNVPLLNYEFDGPPRTAFGYGVLPLLEVLRRLEVLDLQAEVIEHALLGFGRDAQAWGPEQPTISNMAKQIALRLYDRVPVIVGPDVFAVAARRWAGQLAENAKQWAFFEALPEVNHNLIVVLDRRQQAEKAFRVLLLDGPVIHPRNHSRVELTATELANAGVDHEVVPIGAVDPLSAILQACYLGDWVSYYVALLNGVDPLQTSILDRVKSAMAKRH